LAKPDEYIARASWLSYYEKSLKEQGKDISNIDYSKHELNEDAADYADAMVNRQQNISDTDLQGKLFSSKDKGTVIARKLLMPFSSFRLNQFIRMTNDLAVLKKSSLSSAEDKKIAAKSLAGYTAEMVVFKTLSVYLSYLIGSGVKAMMGQDETEEEKDNRLNNLYKGQVTGTVSDVLSPIPLVDFAVTNGVNSAIDGLQAIAGVDERDRYNLYTIDKVEFVKSLGTFGIAADQALKLKELIDLSVTGKYKDDFGRTKYLVEEDRKALGAIAILPLLRSFGLAPAEANTISRYAIKFAKKKSTTIEGATTESQKQRVQEKEQNKQIQTQEKSQKIKYLQDIYNEQDDEQIKSEIKKKIDELSVPIEIKQLEDEFNNEDDDDVRHEIQNKIDDIKEQQKQDKAESKQENKLEKQQKKELLGKYETEADMKKYEPDLYEERFGEDSDWYKAHQNEKEVEKLLNEKEKEAKDELYGYEEKQKKNKDGTIKRGLGGQTIKRAAIKRPH
jgi:hypothetical protein